MGSQRVRPNLETKQEQQHTYMNKLNVHTYVQTYNEICIYIHILIMKYSHLKNILLPFSATLMDLEGIMLSERSQTKKTNTA